MTLGIEGLVSIHNNESNIKVTSFADLRKCRTIGGHALHANVAFMPGQVISRFGTHAILDRPNYLTVQVDESQHIMLAPDFLQYINHSCSPNVYFDLNSWSVKALRNIEIDEEFTFFYPSTEWSMDQGFDCRCGKRTCLGFINGAKHLPLEILTKQKVSPYIKEKIESYFS